MVPWSWKLLRPVPLPQVWNPRALQRTHVVATVELTNAIIVVVLLLLLPPTAAAAAAGAGAGYIHADRRVDRKIHVMPSSSLVCR